MRCETGYTLQWERDGSTLTVDTYRRCLPPINTAETCRRTLPSNLTMLAAFY